MKPLNIVANNVNIISAMFFFGATFVLKCIFASNIRQIDWVFFQQLIILPDFMNIYLEEKLFRVRLCMFNVKRTFELVQRSILMDVSAPV